MTETVRGREETERAAREDWEQRIYRRLTDTSDADTSLALTAPAHVHAEPAVGHVRLSWDDVPGAAGYLIERTGADSRPTIVRHGGSDVPALPAPPFADTGLAEGIEYGYRVGAVAGAEYPVWAWSEPVSCAVLTGDPGVVEVSVDTSAPVRHLDRVWRMIGAERLTQLGFGDDGHGNQIGAEFAESLRRAHDDLGVTHVRAHALLHDDNRVVSRDGGFYDAVDPTTGAVGHRRLVLDQSMEMAALDNALNHGALQRHFARDPAAWAARTYLSLDDVDRSSPRQQALGPVALVG